MKGKKSRYHQKKDSKLFMTSHCFNTLLNGISEIANLLGTTSDNIPRFITKKWIGVHDQSVSANDRYKPSSQI